MKKQPLWRLADVVTPSVALAYVFGRLGCFMNGCCYGKPTPLPWGVQFPGNHETHPTHVHPSQLYDSLLSLTLYLGLAWLYRRKKFDGQVFAVYLMSYAFLRSFIEFFRGDYPSYILGWITPAQLISALTLTAGIVLWALQKRAANSRA
jgi:phosphatidylglycerol:prolipoprotein diacylglycerol transferase